MPAKRNPPSGPLLLVLLLSTLAAGSEATSPLVGGRRSLRAAVPTPAAAPPAPTPAPGPLDRPSGGGGSCIAAESLLPVAGPAVQSAAAELVSQCGAGSSPEYCQEVGNNATYLISAALSITLTLTVAEEHFHAECAGETEQAAAALYNYFAAGVQEAGCSNPDAAPYLAQVLNNVAPKIPSYLPTQYDFSIEAGLDKAALDFGVYLSKDVGTALSQTVATCAANPNPSPTPGASPEPFPPSSPAPVYSPSPSGGDLGDSGGAILPSLEAARHDAFMQIIG